MRPFNHALEKFVSCKSNRQLSVCVLLLTLFCPFAINAQLYSGYTPNYGFDRSYATLQSLIEAETVPAEASVDTQSISLSWSEPVAGGLTGVAVRASSSTPSCSTYTTAPSNAQSLSNGTYTYAVTGASSGTIWGTGTYTDDSPIARAAVHDGHVTAGGKAVIRLTKSAGLSSYTGSTRNGVTSRNYGSWTGSYTLAFVSACTTSSTPAPTPTPTPTPTPAASCSTYTTAPSNAQSLSNGTYTYVVTGASSGTIWGTGTYTDDSPIARAAVHAGHVTAGGKAVIRLTKSAGLSSYTGSTQNGVRSSNYGSWTGSYTLALVSACTTASTPVPDPTPAPDPTPTLAVDTGIPMTGFDFDYKIYGKINSNDLYVVRDSAAAGIPGVAGFYLRVNTNEDEPQFYNLEHPVTRSAAAADGFTHNTNYDMKLKDINSDGAQDLIITGLEDSTLGRWDMIVYASTTTNGSPIGYKEMDQDFKDFFSQLGSWLLDEDYFEDNAGVLASVPEIKSHSWATNSATGNLYFGTSPMPDNSLPVQCGRINPVAGLYAVCLDVYADSDFPNDPSIKYSLTPYAAFVEDNEDDPLLRNGYFLLVLFFSITDKFDIPDYSDFTSAYEISPAIKSVIDTGKLIAGSTVEHTDDRVRRGQCDTCYRHRQHGG